MGESFISSALSWGLTVALATMIVFGLGRGYRHRRKVRSLREMGIPIAAHSWLWGHLPIFIDFRKEHPPDICINVLHMWLERNFHRYCPGLKKPPAVIYLDLWPLGPSFALVYDANAVGQFTRIKSFPKERNLLNYIKPLTSNLDLISADGDTWKLLRARFSPGFSQKTIVKQLPELMSDVSVFTDELKRASGSDVTWGSVVQLRELASKMTFNVICKTTLGRSFSQQSSSLKISLRSALLDQIHLMDVGNDWLTLRRHSPWYQATVSSNNAKIRDIIVPMIRDILSSTSTDDSTMAGNSAMEMAIQHARFEGLGDAELTQDVFSDTLISNLKAFLFAGEDTTASTICFMFKRLQDNPECLRLMQEEHDRVLGPKPDKVQEILTADPNLLYKLPYTLAVIKETLRLHPLASTSRDIPEAFDLIVPCESSTAPSRFPLQGFAPWIAASSIQQNPENWPRPTDFLPERWMQNEDSAKRPQKDAWIPFSLGPRTCTGMELALAQLRLVCVFLARTLDIREAWEEWDAIRGISATPQHMVGGARLYEVGTGLSQPKDGMPIRVKLHWR
ncbi:cytochrome P450 4V3 [Nemania sp. FL0916]|nr:cytochrome P450 4V3 [Nemania sp. FL0916]